MAERLPCFLLNVRKWLCSDTVRALHRMGGRGVNAYMFLLCESWLQTPTGSLPNDEDLLIEFARVSQSEFRLIWPVIKHKFVSNGNGRLFNDELKKEAKTLDAKRKAGESGWTEARRKSQAKHAKTLAIRAKQKT
jgi:uncharacterized protein YdaU (DUF1376 family)